MWLKQQPDREHFTYADHKIPVFIVCLLPTVLLVRVVEGGAKMTMTMECPHHHKSCTHHKKTQLTTHNTHKYHANANDHGLRRCPHMTTFPWSYSHHITPTESPSHALHLAVATYVFSGWFSVGGPPTLLHTKVLTTPAVIMAAADARFDHLPMELRPPYYTYREEITSASYGYKEIILIRLDLRRRPTYGIAMVSMDIQYR
jgi:hypothetical protein